ncbi:DUF1839 family protein [Paenibacillus tundrae]|uniref:DUF1839 family protein n=1 Tax=Paenibacillus tundrae TaxID=528187 RepID=UPI0022A959C8|nr:DUF1839 family protein [Paenibacillus tundrae]MCZ1264763.1 DUF1839 family protein [Paenibacillus tundrae]
MDFDRKKLSIENHSFCLLGVVDAVARYKYDVSNIDKLYFSHTYQYDKYEDKINFQNNSNMLNINFSRQLLFNKEECIQRLMNYYGIEIVYKGYELYDELVKDIEHFSKLGGLLLTEIDIFYINKDKNYHEINDQHVLIITDIDKDQGLLHVLDNKFGFFDLPMVDYKDFFLDVKERIKRPLYLMLVKRDNIINNKINKIELFKDINLTVENRNSENKKYGCKALKAFFEDYLDFLEWNNETLMKEFSIPGLWTINADLRNNLKFLDEFSRDNVDFNSTLLSDIKRKITLLIRKWSMFNRTIYIYKPNKEYIEMTKSIFNEIILLESEMNNLLHNFKHIIEREICYDEQLLSKGTINGFISGVPDKVYYE